MQLSEGHRSRLVAGFGEIDAALIEAARALDIDALRSPFAAHIGDTTPIQQRLVSDYAERMRAAMRAVLKRHRIAPPSPQTSALQAARSALDHAIIHAEELGPRYMCGYGPLNDELEGELNRIVSGLLDQLDTIRGFLDADRSDDLVERIARIDSMEPARALLGELTRVIDAHRLFELRPSLEALIERFGQRDLEVGVFGRVNAGKSSLLNHVLGTDLLPVGGMPVTTVPVYVRYGAEAWGFASFADAASEKFALGRLPEFAAEHFNPSNLRHVTHLRVETPLPALADGLTLVDIPGIDLGTTRGASFITSFVPRCDVGLVLIDAAAGLTLDEAALVTALHRAGSRTIVLVTKVDLLRSSECWTIHGIVERGLERMSGVEVPVFLASTTARDTSLRNDWLNRGLRPLLDRREPLRSASLRRKIERLRAAVVVALRRRLSLVSAAAITPTEWQDASAGLDDVRALLDVACNPFDAHAEADRQTAALIDEVAHNAALLWPENRDSLLDVTTLLAASLEARATGRSITAAREMTKLGACCRLALAAAARAVGAPHVEANVLPTPRPMSSFDGLQRIGTTVLRRPVLAFLGLRWRHRAVQRQIARSAVRPVIADAMRRRFDTVDEWRLDALKELRARFAAASRHLQGLHLRLGQAGPRHPSPEAQSIAADLEALEQFARPHSAIRASASSPGDADEPHPALPEHSESNP